MSYVKKNGIFPSAISGIQPEEWKPQKSTARRRRRKSAKRMRQAEAKRQTQLSCEITDVIEDIYSNLFDRVTYHGVVQNRQSSNRIDRGEKPPEIRAAFQNLSKSALSLGPEMDTWQTIKALRATYWTGVRISGYDFYRPSTVIPSVEAEEECHARASTLRLAMSSLSGPGRRYHAVHGVAFLWGRYYHVAAAYGWKTLAVLLHSIRFVTFARTAAPSSWESLLTCIGENITSLQLVGSFYCRGWDSAVKEALPEGVEILTDDEKKSYAGDYYNWRVPSDKNERVFEGSGHLFKVAETSNWQDKFSRDPRVMKNALGVQAPCSACSQSWTECKCGLENWYPARVELIDTETIGTGVRALQRFKKGQLLAEFVGDMLHVSDDNNYSFNGFGPGKYIISARYNGILASSPTLCSTDSDSYCVTGNWTRFANHSCEANCSIDNVEHHGKRLIIYRAGRDIELFEEITVNYGRDYFKNKGLQCLCNSKEHIT